MTSDLLARGIGTYTICSQIDMSVPAASFPLSKIVPAGAIIIAASLSIPLMPATTAVKVGLGISGTPSAYLLSSGLLAQDIAALQSSAIANLLSADQTVSIFACDTAGAAAGTIGGVGIKAIASITYEFANIVKA